MSKMTDHTALSAPSRRFEALARNFHEREYREGYVAAQLRAFLADQIRALRGDLSQAAFGRLIGKPQNVVSRLEDERYEGISLQTLLDIASKLDLAVLARFVDHETFIRATTDQSATALIPQSYDADRVDQFASAEREARENRGSPQLNGAPPSQTGHGLGPILNHANTNSLPQDGYPIVGSEPQRDNGRQGNDKDGRNQTSLGNRSEETKAFA